MKKMIFLFFLVPLFAHAQFKRSGTELAKENIRQYLTGKLFKGGSYQSISYGELTVHKGEDRNIAWTLAHDFAITEFETQMDRKDSVKRSYRFLFYLDNKMNVLRAERYF
jgi:hypothetical protein